MLTRCKNPLRRCRSHLPLCRNCRSLANRIESYFCRSAVTADRQRKDVFSNSVLAHIRNGRTATAERQNGTLEIRHKWVDGDGYSNVASNVAVIAYPVAVIVSK